MAVRRILRMGHPILRQVGRPIESGELGSEWLLRVIEDMTDTLRDYGGVGLAAPQIGESLQLAIIEITGGPSRYGEIPSMPLTAFINPQIKLLDTAREGFWEGCLSVPGLRGFVERPRKVEVSFMNLDGDTIQLQFSGFFATVIQHELDHLDGKLYLDRIEDTRLLAFEREFERYLAPVNDDEPD